MSPGFSSCDVVDVRYVDLILFGDLFARSSVRKQIADSANIVFGQLGASISFALSLSPLFYHILNIVVWCASKEVIRIYTQAIIALMAHIHSFRNWPVMQFVTNAMRQVQLPIVMKLSVTRIQRWAFPYPAFTEGTRHAIRPETIVQGQVSSSIMSADITNGQSFDVTEFTIGSFCDRRGLSATAFAKFYGGLFSGMIHGVSLLHGLTIPLDDSRRRSGFVIGFRKCILAQMG